MKKLLILFILFGNTTFGQNFSNRWQGHFSYFNITDISEGIDEVFVSSQNAVFSYNLLSKEIKTITTVDGLSGQVITAIHYSKDFKKLVIGYATGLLDVYDPLTEDVITVVDIINKLTIPPDRKRVNNMFEFGNKIFIACQFGIVEYNLERLEFGDTFFMGSGGGLLNVTQLTVFQDRIFAATAEEGIRIADVNNPNLIDFNNWSTLISGNWTSLVQFNNTVFATRSNRQLWRYNGSNFANTGFTHPTAFARLRANENFMTLTTTKAVFAFNTSESVAFQLANFQNNELTYTSATVFENRFFVGTTEGGLLVFTPPDLTNATVTIPNGPLRNDPFQIQAAPNELWVVYGIYSFSYNPSPLDRRGISHLENGDWINIPASELRNAADLSYVNISPFDNKVYVSSFFSGILVIEDNQILDLWDSTNSGLETLLPGRVDVRIHDTQFDRNGDLWATNNRIENAIKVLRSSGQWESFSVADVIAPDNSNPSNPFLGSELALSNMVIDRNGTKWIATFGHGLLGFRETAGGFQLKNLDEVTGNLPINDIRALSMDSRNRLWIGTRDGLRVLFNTSGFFEEENPRAEEIIILQNGLAEELLFGQLISDIETDGSDNKWVATIGSGVFMFSPDGQRTLQRFTTDNSPLPSNTVNDISIDGASGRVYFATDRGLVSFLSNATQTRDNLDDVIVFPNPVKPDFNGNLTIRNLSPRAKVKITDISGNLVFETIAQGGSIEWDLRAFGRYKVASGVYMIIITDRDGQNTKVNKVMIIR
ncbi:MAG: T9SS type A sorting domain-containing protein [Bacteroidetes bacterium]|nr:T9SS type A sorting domain-containing protein [Bacteroidota bacterium]